MFKTEKSVVVADAVDDAIANKVCDWIVSFGKAWTESLANGEVEPTPSRFMLVE